MDLELFRNTAFSERTHEEPVPELKSFFPEGQKPIWIVKGLTGHEYGHVNEKTESSGLIPKLIQKAATGLSSERVSAILELLGDTTETPKDIVRRLEMLVMGSVDPKIDKPDAVKLCDALPLTFLRLTNKIIELTGQGKAAEGLTPCGDGTTSK